MGRETLAGDARFGTPEARKAHDEQLAAILQDIFAGQPVAYWQRVLDDAGVPCSPQVAYPDMASEPHFMANELIVTHEHPVYGRVAEPGCPAHFSDTPGTNWRPPLLLGEYTDEVLTDLGYAKEKIDALRTGKVIK
ncbi:MAG: Formyl-coenzyme A transferase [Syntrophaceae bacterium PtaU1.Bin231]|nr:MAG: Formyl-coenzyme A transferase [Syntrophaceae bacterium PtaU1.Bin231]